MIKRRFFKVEHADGNDASDTSSSSSDSEVEEEHLQESESEDNIDDVPQIEEHKESDSSSSGYKSEDSSAKEVEADSSDDAQSGEAESNTDRKKLSNKSGFRVLNAVIDIVDGKDLVQLEEAYILKNKSVFKCRLCPRVICLTEESLKTHVKSKRHARSTKLLNEGRLKLMLNSDGEIEEDGETHAERLARTAAIAHNLAGSKKKNKGRQRQKNRMKKKKDDSSISKATPSMDIPPKKRLKGSQK